MKYIKILVALFLLTLPCLLIMGCDSSVGNSDNSNRVNFSIQSSGYDMVVMGDNQPSFKKLEHFINIANALKPKYLVHVGDRVPFSSPLTYQALMKSLKIINKDITFIPVVGNHDVSRSNLDASMKLHNYFFNYPENFQGYYSLNTENQYLIFLNSYLPGATNKISRLQLDWLTSELENAQNRDIYVFLHHPVFEAGYHPPIQNRDELHDLIKDYNVKAVFSGHEHLFYKKTVDDIPYYVTGGAGSSLYSSENGEKVHHILGINFSPFKVDMITEDGSVIPK